MDDRIIQYYSHQLTPKEQEQFLVEVFRKPEVKHDMMAMENLQALYNLYQPLKDEQEGRESYIDFQCHMAHKRHYMMGKCLLKYAAVILIGGFLSWFLSLQFHAGNMEPMAQVLSVPQGQRARITLPDGSTVWVNSGSTLKYPSVFTNERQVELVGEASFDVVRNPERPFKVSVSGNIIKVLGTHFNVFGYSRKPLTVSLLRGKVNVYSKADPSKGVVLVSNQEVTVLDGRYQVGPIEEDPILWQQGILSFHNVSMAELAGKLEVYYNVKINIKNPTVAGYVFSGKLRQGNDVVHVLHLLQEIHSFHMKYVAGSEYIEIY